MTTTFEPTTFGQESAHVLALDSVVSGLESLERQSRAIEAERLRLLAESLGIATAESERAQASSPQGRRAELAYRSVRAEVAAALHLSEATIEQKMSHAHALVSDYPSTFDALRTGLICERHTVVIVDAGTVIGGGDSPDAVFRRAAYEAAVLDVAIEETPNRLRPIARRLAERYSEATIDERHEQSRASRRVQLIDRDDGMSDLIAYLPSTEAHEIYGRLTAMSKRLAQIEAVEGSSGADLPQRRSRDELRTDLFSDLLRRGAPEQVAGVGAIAAQIQVVVTDQTLFASKLRIDDGADLGEPSSLAPADLTECGPIPTETARTRAASADHWQLVHQDFASGVVLKVDRYRPSEEMRRLLGARDLHCRFPGCRVPLARCDIDHTFDAALGGSTATDNLAHLCRGHHTLKHHTGWTVAQQEGGLLAWRSPTGRRHADRPPSRVRFAGVAQQPAHSTAPF